MAQVNGILAKINELENRIEAIDKFIKGVNKNHDHFKSKVENLEKEKESLEEQLEKLEETFFGHEFELPFYYELVESSLTNNYDNFGDYLIDFLKLPGDKIDKKKLFELYLTHLDKIPQIKVEVDEFEAQVLYYFTNEKDPSKAYFKLLQLMYGGDEAKLDKFSKLFVSDSEIEPDEEIQKQVEVFSKKVSLLLDLSLLLKRYGRPSFAIESMCDAYSEVSDTEKDPLAIRWILDVYDAIHDEKDKYNKVFLKLFGKKDIGYLLLGVPEFLNKGEGRQFKHAPYMFVLSTIGEVAGYKVKEFKVNKPDISPVIYVPGAGQMPYITSPEDIKSIAPGGMSASPTGPASYSAPEAIA